MHGALCGGFSPRAFERNWPIEAGVVDGGDRVKQAQVDVVQPEAHAECVDDLDTHIEPSKRQAYSAVVLTKAGIAHGVDVGDVEALRIGVRLDDGPFALGRLVHVGGRFASEGVVRAHVIEVLAPAVQSPLLLSDRRSRIALDLGAYVRVHALVAAVVLRTAWPRTHHANAQRHPPGRKGAQSRASAHGDERRSVVALDGFGHAMATEQLLEDGTHRVARCPTGDERPYKAAAAIAHTQRLATRAVEHTPPAFEVDRPHVVGRARLHGRRLLDDTDRGTFATLAHHVGALENARDRAHRRRLVAEAAM